MSDALGAPEVGLLRSVPDYPFALLEGAADRRRREGLPLLPFHLGDPDLPPPAAVLEAAARAVRDPGTRRYSTSRGEPELREAIAAWMDRRFGVELDADREVVVLLGSKEGLAALPRVVAEPGEVVAIPDPGYPAYRASALLAGTRPEPLPLRESGGWTPDWDALDANPRLVYLNYPQNPTGAVVDRGALREAVERARDGAWTLAYDNAYSEVTFGDRPARSILEIPGARDVAVEFHSFSKTFGVPGWRLGFAVGNAERLAGLVKLKAQSDSGATLPIQRAGAAALELYRGPERPPEVEANVRAYGRRLRHLAEGLRASGFSAEPPGGGLYLWQRAPGGSGVEFAERLLATGGVLVTPGSAFGSAGAPFVRWAVTRPEAEIEAALEAVARLAGSPTASVPRPR